MNVRSSCTDCVYRRSITHRIPAYTVCHYLLDTGTPRGCSAEHCTHWQAKTNEPESLLMLLELIKEANKLGA